MKIAFCSSEVFPFAKTGGLADVSGALALALAKKGCKVKVFTPLYKNIKPDRNGKDYAVSRINNVEFFFIRNDSYFMRDGLYGTPQGDYPDNLERFSFFSKRVFEVLKEINFSPQIIHSHDWQVSLVNIYLKTLYREDSFFNKAKCILTIHNLAYQGIFDKEQYPLLGLSWDYFNMHCLEFYEKINLLKGGIVLSDIVNTVSTTYSEQIQTPEYGCGLDGVLRQKQDRLLGIVNAIDYDVWNPKKDKLIYKTYSGEDLDNKYVNKRMFQKELGLETDKDAFFLGMVSRLVEQKGVDILAKALGYLLKDYQVVILGFGDEKYHKILKSKAGSFKKSFSLNLKFDERLAHNIYAACDAFLMPSRFEPCGLSQMISYKYATVPVVHATGGLVDTVIDYVQGGGGFVFHSYSAEDLISAIDRAYEVFKNQNEWRRLLKKITTYNFSWERTAQKYIEMYEKVGRE